jgi:DHA2 family multidrug resistance protein
VFGPLLGGPLTDNFGWRSVFYVNVPLGIIDTFMAIHLIKEPVKNIIGFKHFDWFGSICLAVSLGALVLVLDQGQTWGWSSTGSIICYVITLVMFILFVVIEHSEPEPVVNLKLFNIPSFSISNIASFISMMGLNGGIFLLPIFMENQLGFSVTKSGYVFIPMAIGLMAGSQIGVMLYRRFPPRYFVTLGMFFAAYIFYSFTGIDILWGYWSIALRLALFALGLGIGFGPLTQAAISTIPIKEVGVASSILALSRNLAGAFGTAIFATLLSNFTTDFLIKVQNNSVINTINPQLLQIIPGLMESKANILAYGSVFLWAAVLVMLGGIVTFFLPDIQIAGKTINGKNNSTAQTL